MRIDNPDDLPYYIMENGHSTQVHFMPLDAGDDTYINEWWRASTYFALWQHLAQHEVTRQTSLKLVPEDEEDAPILGLLRMGRGVSVRASHGKLNTQSVLETAPHLQYHVKQRNYQGIGKVLVARLIAASILRGHGGALIVSPRPQVIPFYRHLGFQPFRRDAKRFYILEEAGNRLLESVLLRSDHL